MEGNAFRKTLIGFAVGAASGLVASFAMDKFQTKVWRLITKLARGSGSEEPATVVGAEKIAETFHRTIPDDKKQLAGSLVHYLFGTMTGAAYGGLAAWMPHVRSGVGLPYGTAVFLLADEGMVPALGLSKNPRAYPFSTHLYAFASHLVYGLTLNRTERLLRAIAYDNAALKSRT